MKRPNALNPHHMSPAERRAELCSLLALGLVRIHMRNADQPSAKNGEFPLHNPTGRSGTATVSQRRAS